jgi:LPS-assembly protein
LSPRLCIVTSLLLGFSPLARAQSVTDGVLINARFMDRDMEKKTVVLKGDVQVVFKGQHLSSDRALLDMGKQQVIAEGHVVLYNEKAHAEGDKVVFNYKDSTGFIYNGFVQSGQVIFEGEVIEKVGDNHYIASNAEYTACETCPAGWSFSGRKIDAEIGGYAHIQRPVFHIAGVPVLILPSLIVPLKSARQSGVLVPSMDVSSKGGIALSGIYFWAIDRSSDLTMIARWYQLRGYKLLEDYRYVLSKDSKGDLKGAWMDDKVLKNEYSLLPNHVNRWFVDYSHYQELPNGYVQRMDLRDVSDLRYTRDFPEEIKGHGDPALENKASISKLMENHYASMEADLYSNLLKYYPYQRNDDAVNRMPELRYSFKEQRLFDGGPLLKMDVDYVNFQRSSYNYDDLTRCQSGIYRDPKDLTTAKTCPLAWDGVNNGLVPLDQGYNVKGQISRNGQFDRATDLWRTGQRLDLQPTLSYPFQVFKKFDILPSVTYRETQYRFDPTDTAEQTGANGEPGFNTTAARRYVQADVLAKTEFSRVFGDLENPKSNRWKHSLEPEVGYSQIPWMRTPNHPFFGTYTGFQYSRQYDPVTDPDIGNPNTGVQFDYNDRTFERRVVTYGFLNRLTRKVWNDGSPDYKTVAVFKVGQSYDFKEAQRGTDANPSHPWSLIDALIDVRLDHFETYTTASYSPYKPNITDISTRVKGMLTPKNYLQVSYTRYFNLDNNYHVVDNGETRAYGVGGGFISKYIEFEGHLDFTDLRPWDPSIQFPHSGIQVLGWGYGMVLRPPGRCLAIRIEHSQVLGGDAAIHGSLDFDFGGETKNEAATRSQAI